MSISIKINSPLADIPKKLSKRYEQAINKAIVEVSNEVRRDLGIGRLCKRHKPRHGSDYLAWHDWAEHMYKRGSKQKRCRKCKRYLFPCEY